MTLIATYINKYGITFLSDSNLSTNKGNAGFGQKIFPISHLNAAVAYSGSYSVNSSPIDIWINNYITGSFHTTKTIEEFVKELTQRLNSEMKSFELEHVTIIHIAGYHREDSQSYIQHFHISNTGLNHDGSYSKPTSTFKFSLDFDSMSNKEHRTQLISYDFDSSFHTWFINGLTEARICANYIRTVLDDALKNIWANPQTKFRKPKNIFESATIWKINMEIVCKLFKLSDHEALFVGGEIQTHLIPEPQDINKSNLQ